MTANGAAGDPTNFALFHRERLEARAYRRRLLNDSIAERASLISIPMTRKSLSRLRVYCAFAAAVIFIVRQHELKALQAGNESLRGQVDLPDGDAASAPVAEVSPASSAAQLSPEEKNELLRLRGQVPPLRTEVVNASNRVARLAEAPARTVASPPSRSAGAQRQPDSFDQFVQTEPYQEANALGRAVQQYLEQHAGKIPTRSVAYGGAKVTDAGSADSELVRSGVIADGPDNALPVDRPREGSAAIARRKMDPYVYPGERRTDHRRSDGIKPNPDDRTIRVSEARARQRAEHLGRDRNARLAD
jgi:hypothetical protein